MQVHGKIWGTTSPIFCKNNVEIHRIVGKKGGRSSNHKHISKHSMFFVEKGKIKIVIEKNDYSLIDETILTPGQSITISPHEYHYFEVIEDDSIAYEIYWTQIDPNDIERKNVGSLDSTVKLERIPRPV
jgi:quercetin dioxygenase-like cupin family protein